MTYKPPSRSTPKYSVSGRGRVASVPILAADLNVAALRQRYDAASDRSRLLYDMEMTGAQQNDEWRAACAEAEAAFTEWINARKATK